MASEDSAKSFIRFAGMDIPAHMAWKKIEVLNTAADNLERLNGQYPHLATEFSREILAIVRKRLKTSVSELGKPKELDNSYIDMLKELIKTDAPEDCLDKVRSAYNIDLNIQDLIYHVGEVNYMEAMIREAELYRDNKILPEQTAELWNQMERPAPGKQHWTGKDVLSLLGES